MEPTSEVEVRTPVPGSGSQVRIRGPGPGMRSHPGPWGGDPRTQGLRPRIPGSGSAVRGSDAKVCDPGIDDASMASARDLRSQRTARPRSDRRCCVGRDVRGRDLSRTERRATAVAKPRFACRCLRAGRVLARTLSSYQPPPPQPYIHKHNPIHNSSPLSSLLFGHPAGLHLEGTVSAGRQRHGFVTRGRRATRSVAHLERCASPKFEKFRSKGPPKREISGQRANGARTPPD